MPRMQKERPDETTFGYEPDPGKEPALAGHRMSFLDDRRPTHLPPDEAPEQRRMTNVRSEGSHTPAAPTRRLNIFGE